MSLPRILKTLPLILPAEHPGDPALIVECYQLHMAQAITPTIFSAKVRSRATTEKPACAATCAMPERIRCIVKRHARHFLQGVAHLVVCNLNGGDLGQRARPMLPNFPVACESANVQKL